MKAITERTRERRTNAWGRDNIVGVQRFQVEESDVGRTMDHYLGYRHRNYKFTTADVGRAIEWMYYGGGEGSWAFVR